MTTGASITVVTFNVHHGAPARGLARWRSTIDVIERLAPDVAGLQEVERGVPRSWFVDQTRRVADRLGYHAVYTPTHRYGPAGVLGYAGNALLSRQPLTDVETWALPRRGPEHRFATFARTGPSDAPVTIVNTHLVNDDVPAARAQLAALLHHLETRVEPWILTGDLNLEASNCHDLLRDAGLDPIEAGPTSPANKPKKTIDWIATQGLEVIEAEVPATEVSDHRPVLARLAPIASIR